jgi:hypothetical protein
MTPADVREALARARASEAPGPRNVSALARAVPMSQASLAQWLCGLPSGRHGRLRQLTDAQAVRIAAILGLT